MKDWFEPVFGDRVIAWNESYGSNFKPERIYLTEDPDGSHWCRIPGTRVARKYDCIAPCDLESNCEKEKGAD